MSEADIVIYGFAVSVIVIIGFFIGFAQTKINRVRMLRRMDRGKKNWGLLRIITRGGNTIEAIQDLNEPFYKVGDKGFNPQKNAKGKEKTERGVPILYFDETDSRPLRLEDGTITNNITNIKPIDLDNAIPKRLEAKAVDEEGNEFVYEISNDPTAMLAGIMAYDQAKEAEFKQREKKKSIETLVLYAAALGAIVGAYLIYQQGAKLDEMTKSINALATTIEALKLLHNIPVA